MKRILSLAVGGLFLFLQAGIGFASTTFTVSAAVPLATGVGFTVASVNATTNVFTTLPAGTIALNFGTLTSTNVGTTAAPSFIYLPSIYYALDIATTGGAGAPDSIVTYTEGVNPNGTTNGLGYKGTATFVKETYTGPSTPPTETGLTDQGPKKRFVDLKSQHIPYTDVTGGWLRVYVGIWNGSTTATYPDPTNGQPFTAADAPGTYSGTLTFTETVN